MLSKPPEPRALSVVIQHYNRPWCLEIAVSLLARELAREGLEHQIILADDGSDPCLRSLFDRLPLTDVVIQPQHHCDEENASVYHTLQMAYDRVRFPFVLFLQEDFWLVPQGFIDRDKCHLAGLQTVPDFATPARSFSAAMRLLNEHPEAHMVELARSFANERYHCRPESECVHDGIRFQAKVHARHPHFYSCDWPHVMRAGDDRAVPMPTGRTVWEGERVLVACRRDIFGPGDWVYNPERCFFAHVNVFTWRAVFKHGLADRALRWEGAESSADLPFGQTSDVESNARLMQAYRAGQLDGVMDHFDGLGPLGYLEFLHRMISP